MRLLMRSLLLAVTILCASGLATACGSNIGSSVSSAISSRTSGQAVTSPPTTASSPPTTATSSPTTVSSSPEASTSSPVPSVTSSAPASSAAPGPAAQPSASAAATPNESSSPPIWIWIVIGLVVLIGAIVLIARSARRRAAAAASWRTKIIDVYAEGSALLDAMRIADVRGLVAGDPVADAQWSDIQRRADDLTRELYALREKARDDEDRARVADVLAALQAARSAMDSQRAGGAPSGPGEELVRSRLAAFEASLRTLRSAYQPSA
jgi:hypothetical protein